MSATTSPHGSSSGRASVPPGGGRASVPSSGRAGVSPGGNYGPAPRDNWPTRGSNAGGPPPRGPGRTGQPYKGRRPKPRWGRIALIVGVVVLIIGLIAGISLYSYAN